MPEVTGREAIAALHAAYVRETGFQLSLDMAREQDWYEWFRRGLTPDDVVALVARQKWLAKNGLPCRDLKFRNFVGRPDFAEEDLAEMRARDRVRPPSPHRQEVLRATGRVAPDGADEPVKAQLAGDVVAKFLEDLKKASK